MSVLSQLRRSRPARVIRNRVWHPIRVLRKPVLTVVVPFHNTELHLAETLRTLKEQQLGLIEVILVDDGSTDASPEIARAWARRRPGATVIRQENAGVGAARRLGLSRAKGEYVAFCDADDLIPSGGYARLVGILNETGSDLAVGAVAVQQLGVYRVPGWVRRSNPRVTTQAALREVPDLLGNLMLGARVFRRDFWDRAGIDFADDERGDPSVVVGTLLAAGSIDIVPDVVYRWSYRSDKTSLVQRDLQDLSRVGDRVRSFREAGQLLIAAGASEDVQESFFAELLHSVIPDLVKSAVYLDSGYWESLTSELRALIDLMSPETSHRVPVEDRVIAWLAAHDLKTETEEFLEYSYENRNGYPVRVDEQGDLHITLPLLEDLPEAPASLTEVAVADMALRTRLHRVHWEGDLLRVEGGAFLQYADDQLGPTTVTLVFTDRDTGEQTRVPTQPDPTTGVNLWAARTMEDHEGGGFRADLDVAALAPPADPTGKPSVLRVTLELEIGKFRGAGEFRTHTVGASVGHAPAREVQGTLVQPRWRENLGLQLRFGGAPKKRKQPPATAVIIDRVRNDGDRFVISGSTTAAALQFRLAGPRTQAAPVDAMIEAGRFEAVFDSTLDEWGVGTAYLPADLYEVQVRPTELRRGRSADPAWAQAYLAPEVTTLLPSRMDGDQESFLPVTNPESLFNVRIVPEEWQRMRAPYLRRRLRNTAFPASQTKPLLNTVLFETFAGKSTGDNPGAICAEFNRRGLDIDLVFATIDNSTVLPEGARRVLRWSEEWFDLVGRSRWLVVNASLPYFFRKREGQCYFQTWHGTPLKRIAHDRPHLDFFNWNHRRQLMVAQSQWDYLLSQGEFCSASLSSAFRYSGPTMEVGYPRNDVLSSDRADEVRRRVRRHFGIADSTRVILYAPTWRDNHRVGYVFNKVLYLDPERVVRELGDAVVLVRGHYNSTGAAEEHRSADRVLDVTRYPDIADLYLAADALVTDYSSVFFDFSITDKPMYFLAPDLIEYRDNNRGFYLDYHETVPGPICVTNDEIIAQMKAPDRYVEQRAAFRERFVPYDDAHASERVVDRLLAEFPPLD